MCILWDMCTHVKIVPKSSVVRDILWKHTLLREVSWTSECLSSLGTIRRLNMSTLHVPKYPPCMALPKSVASGACMYGFQDAGVKRRGATYTVDSLTIYTIWTRSKLCFLRS